MNKKAIEKKFISGQHWIIILIIIISGYSVYSWFNEKSKWSLESKKILIEKCISDSKNMAEKYPELTRSYCECSIEKIQKNFTQKEYIEISKQDMMVQEEKLLPSFKNCLNEYQEKIKKGSFN
uniref:hypothetical protein n=1 Tax=uncultured Tenacibaculum sp. TaxID=174713 RepID=UPI00260C48F6|nr:hypothetical protein [uncultured Tenacibaculum sp.]